MSPWEAYTIGGVILFLTCWGISIWVRSSPVEPQRPNTAFLVVFGIFVLYIFIPLLILGSRELGRLALRIIHTKLTGG